MMNRRTPEKMDDPYRGIRFRIYRDKSYEPSNVEAQFLCERIRDLGNGRDHIEAQRDMALVAFYKTDPVACAKLCDELIDPRGELLGRVRQWVADEDSRG